MNAVSRSIPTRQKAAVVYVHDYRPEKEERQALSNLEEVLKRTLPGMETGLYSAYGPFEDDVGIQCHFDGSRMFLAEQKRIKGLRVDILTSLATLSRLVAQFCPEIVVGSGQGGLVAMCLTKPLVLELMLQMRNAQREEAHRIAEAWGKVRVVVAQRPAFGRIRPLLEYFEKCCPEFFKEFPVEGPELFVVLGRTSSRHDEIKGFLDRWGVAVVRSLEDVPLAGSLDRPAKEMFAHEGTCPCGKRTYLFGRCPSCIKKEADEELEQVLEEEMPNAGKGGLEEALDKELEFWRMFLRLMDAPNSSIRCSCDYRDLVAMSEWVPELRFVMRTPRMVETSRLWVPRSRVLSMARVVWWSRDATLFA